jgi:glycosyltransferase involved in cell wall biosynthesis
MADVLAFASTTDTQSLVLAEAEAAGLPVVVADAALARRPAAMGLKSEARAELKSDRESCAAEPESLAAALFRMLTDVDLRERTRRAGLRATAEYPPSRHLALLNAAYASSQAGRVDSEPSPDVEPQCLGSLSDGSLSEGDVR